LSATYLAKGFYAKVQFGPSLSLNRLHFVVAGSGAYNAAVSELSSRAAQTNNRTRMRAVDDLDRLRSQLTTLTREAHALTDDVASLIANNASTTEDLAQLTKDNAAAAHLIAESPPAPHAAVCKAVDTVHADAGNVAGDAQFTAGFITGLATTRKTVDQAASSVRSLDPTVRSELSSLSLAQRSEVPPPVQVQSALSSASTVDNLVASKTTASVSAANGEVKSAYGVLNGLIAKTACGSKIAVPAPVS
jgi:hypothetical protein